MAIDGILNLDKPRGKTSFDIVAKIRRISGERKVGHAGTLDPDATGVLVVCLGQATRMVEYLAAANKAYRAEVEFGTATDTYDASGQIVTSGDASRLSRRDVEDAAGSFVGLVEQVPPAYSALKHQGVALYRLARAGVDVPRKARLVEFQRVAVVDWQSPVAILDVECGKGTYIRSLAHDLGERLGCGAHLRSLVRVRSGGFCIEDSVSVEQVEAAFSGGAWRELVQPVDVAVQHLPRVSLDEAEERRVLDGRPVAGCWQEAPAGGMCRAHGPDGRLVAILAYDEQGECWRPRKVLGRRPDQS